jgi:coenzyme F420 hydrogenase subunit beta
LVNSKIEKIDKNGLCLGCGLCESICGSDNVKMELQKDGFYHPNVKNIDAEKEKIIQKVCPSINVVNDEPLNTESKIWGNIEELYSTYSTDDEIRTKGSSGGTISGIAASLLEHKIVDAVLQVGGDSDDYTRNTLRISQTRNDVLECASSRYAPALVFNKIIEFFESTEFNFAFVGKPCDISALKNLLEAYPQYQKRIKLTMAIVCAGLPSINATEKLISDFKPKLPIKGLVYRGNGWPGFFSFKDKEKNEYKMSYNDSWGHVLGKQIHFRCKICPDGIGLQADFAIGDAWETKDGYPDFTEKEGHSLLIVRTERGKNILKKIEGFNALEVKILEKDKLKLMQPYQYNRRTRAGARVLAYSLAKGVWFNFKNLNIKRNSLSISPKLSVREFIGTFKRSLKL